MGPAQRWRDRLRRFLDSPLGRGVMALGPVYGGLMVLRSADLDVAGRGVPTGEQGPLPGHPERVRVDVPLSPLELRLMRELARQDPDLSR